MSTDYKEMLKESWFPAKPNDMAFPCPDSQSGLTKREYFAAMAKAPSIVIDKVIDLWKGDNNKLPGVGTRDFDQMLKDVAEVEARYQSIKADALLHQLNQDQ